MSTLLSRMTWSEANTYPSKTIIMHDSPVEQPLMRVMIFPGTVTYEDTEPLISADGAPITATGKGQWGQLYAAGRM